MRLKIILGNLIIVVLIGLAAFLVIRSQLQANLSAQVDARIGNDRVLFDRSWRLSALGFLENVRDRAATQEVATAFGALDEEARRKRTHEAANSISRWFMNPARGRQGGPDVVVITDETGKVIARDKDINRMHDRSLVKSLPSLRGVLRDGTPRHDVWKFADEDKLLQTGLAPIRNASGAVIGALVVGYELSNGLAEREAEVLGRDVAFLHGDEVYSASVAAEAVDPLEKKLFGPLEDRTRAAFEGQTSAPWQAEVSAEDHTTYVGVAAPLPMSPSVKVAYAVMADRSEHMAMVGAIDIILLLTVLGALGVLIYGWVIGGSFLRPVEQIEEDVLRIINGRTDLRLDIQSAEFGGLAYRINQLINVFTGVSEEDEQGRVSQAPPGSERPDWQDAAFSGGGTSQQSGGSASGDPIDDPQVASELEAEPAEQYYERIHREYVAAKEAAGEDVSNIPKDRFIKRIQGNERALSRKHEVRMVRFRVEAAGSHVQLRPVLIR